MNVNNTPVIIILLCGYISCRCLCCVSQPRVMILYLAHGLMVTQAVHVFLLAFHLFMERKSRWKIKSVNCLLSFTWPAFFLFHSTNKTQ